jgi:hypothetical protein
MAIANVLAGVALGVWFAQNVIATIIVAGYRRGLPQSEFPGAEPQVAVILPVRGAGRLAEFLPALRGQVYDHYRIIATVESRADPAFALLESERLKPGAPLEIVVAGLASDAGQKVWNQLAALDRLAPEDEIVVLIDADTAPTPLWLPRLVAVVVNSGRPVATGYRWMVPADGRASSCGLAAANNVIAALPRGPLPMPLVWGGSVALRQETLRTIRLRDFWRGAISDDGQMAEALREAGLNAHAPRQGLLLTRVSASWADFFEFGIRQYRFVFLHQPRSWAAAAATLWAPPVCLALAIPGFLVGTPGPWVILAIGLALGEARLRIRRSIEQTLWPAEAATRDPGRWRKERLLRPVWWMAHALSAACAPLSRRIVWAGIRYRVDGPQRVVIEAREAPR